MGPDVVPPLLAMGPYTPSWVLQLGFCTAPHSYQVRVQPVCNQLAGESQIRWVRSLPLELTLYKIVTTAATAKLSHGRASCSFFASTMVSTWLTFTECARGRSPRKNRVFIFKLLQRESAEKCFFGSFKPQQDVHFKLFSCFVFFSAASALRRKNSDFSF